MTSYQSTYKRLVTYFGGQQKTAAALGCTQPSVWAWLQGNAHMSAFLAIKTEKLTDGEILSTELCPALASLEQDNSNKIDIKEGK